ncbi:MAG TPA: FGGY family carbohydrate kinase [Egibacteraceae bacterium]|nr:FGGY family carbohydrate kinase [Egibacteraceae bacterium]
MTARAGSEAVIGVDIGTTTAKAAAYDRDGNLLAAAGREYPLHAPAPGRAELDPDGVLAAVTAVLGEVVAAARSGGAAVAGVALSSAMHTLLALDAATTPLTPVVTYADNRAAEEARALRAGVGAEVYRRTGTPVQPMAPLAKLRWFRAHEPQVWRDAARWVSIKEYVLLRMLRSGVVDHSVAAATGMLDLAQLRWCCQPRSLTLVWSGSVSLGGRGW